MLSFGDSPHMYKPADAIKKASRDSRDPATKPSKQGLLSSLPVGFQDLASVSPKRSGFTMLSKSSTDAFKFL
jgi:hypothetical protein